MEVSDESKLIRLREGSINTLNQKYEITKLIIFINLLQKFGRYRARIYTEFPTAEDYRCSVYYENLKLQKALIFIIDSSKNIDYSLQLHKNLKIPFINSIHLIPIILKEQSNDFKLIDKKIKQILEDLK